MSSASNGVLNAARSSFMTLRRASSASCSYWRTASCCSASPADHCTNALMPRQVIWHCSSSNPIMSGVYGRNHRFT